MTEQEQRELNKRIAVEVMGLRVYEVTPEQYSMYIQKERDYVYEGELYYLTGCQAHRVPDYLTDIAAAWQVVERMRELGWRVSVWTNADVWCAQFEQEIDYCETAPTAPEAICAAALAALGKGEA